MDEAEKLLPQDSVPEKQDSSIEWYFKWWAIALAMFAVGPLGLILVWVRPATKLSLKVIISIFVLALTVWSTIGAVNYYQILAQHYRELAEVLNGTS